MLQRRFARVTAAFAIVAVLILPVLHWTLPDAAHRAIAAPGISNPYTDEAGPLCGELGKPLCPLIFIPGAGGSRLEIGGDEYWPNANGYLVDAPLSKGHNDDEALLRLSLDRNGIGPFRHPTDSDLDGEEAAVTSIVGDEFVVPGVSASGAELYGPALSWFRGAGYRDLENLFLYPWDWRMSVSEVANRPHPTSSGMIHDLALKDFIDYVRLITGMPYVDIVAHSQGGLLALHTLNDPKMMEKVRRLVTLGTPVHGAAKLYGMFEFQQPCFVPEVHLPFDAALPQLISEWPE